MDVLVAWDSWLTAGFTAILLAYLFNNNGVYINGAMQQTLFYRPKPASQYKFVQSSKILDETHESFFAHKV